MSDIEKMKLRLSEKALKEKIEKQKETKEDGLPMFKRLQLKKNTKWRIAFEGRQRSAMKFVCENKFKELKGKDEELFKEFIFEYYNGASKSIYDFLEKRGHIRTFDTGHKEEKYPELNKKYLAGELTKEEYWDKIRMAEDHYSR